MAYGASAGSLVFVGLEELIANVEAMGGDGMNNLAAVANEIGDMLAAYAIRHHPWKVRTGKTNFTTEGGIVERARDFVTIGLTAAMYYDEFLELAKSGKWSWLWPAVVANEDRMIRMIAKAMTSPIYAYRSSRDTSPFHGEISLPGMGFSLSQGE